MPTEVYATTDWLPPDRVTWWVATASIRMTAQVPRIVYSTRQCEPQKYTKGS